VPSNTFDGVPMSSCTLHVPAGKETLYKAADVWKQFYASGSGTSGTTGSLSWSLSGGTLTISGNGAIPNYSYDDNTNFGSTPWNSAKESITAVIIGNGVTGIGTHAFAGCSNLTSVTIPNSVTWIGTGSFADCSSLPSIVIPNSVTRIQESAFQLCSSLTSVSIGNSVTEIGVYAFVNCSSLQSVTIPNSVTWVGWGAFTNCISLRSVVISNSMTTIEDSTFGGCTSLASITIPNSVTTIGSRSFGGCSMTSITIPNSVTTIEWDAFNGCRNLTSVTIPNSVTTIGANAFAYCSSLASVTSQATAPPSLGTGAFSGIATGCSLTVPAGSANAYASSSWSDWFTIGGNSTLLTVTPSLLDFTKDGGTASVSVTSNIGWTAVSNAAWLTVAPASGSGNGSITVTASANASTGSRTATITVSGSGITRTIAVTQASATTSTTLAVSPSSFDFAAAGGTTSVSVTSNVSWTASDDAAWITLAPASGNGDGTITVTASANASATPRTATITVSGGGITRTATVTQPAAPTLTVAPATLNFAKDGGRQEVNVTANNAWTAVSNAPWLTVTKVSTSVLRITASANTGYSRTSSVTVTAGGLTQEVYIEQDAAQQIIADPKPPVDNQGLIEIALEIPVNEEFNITFSVSLPLGFVLNQQATSLTSDLLSRYQLSITPDGRGGWLFTVTPKMSVRSGSDAVYRKVVDIVYEIPTVVQPGDYEVKLQDVDLTTAGGTTVHQDEIAVPVTVAEATGNGFAAAAQLSVWYAAGQLTVDSQSAEQITIYTPVGIAVYRSQKTSGQAVFHTGSLPSGVLIVTGSSGWTRKIVQR
jgi:Flp pilus assembly protein protease CpaA